MILTEKILKSCMPHATDANVALFVNPLNLTCEKYAINTNRRQAAFLAQVAHESNNLAGVSENLNYSAIGLLKTFEYYFMRTDVARYEHKPEMIANRVYANRYGNGDEQSGDGWKFRARGLIGITFKDNYEALGIALNYNFINDPDALTKPGAAALSAGWYWNLRELNRIADVDGFERITKKINGGLNGYEDRLKLWETCRKALNVTI